MHDQCPQFELIALSLLILLTWAVFLPKVTAGSPHTCVFPSIDTFHALAEVSLLPAQLAKLTTGTTWRRILCISERPHRALVKYVRS